VVFAVVERRKGVLGRRKKRAMGNVSVKNDSVKNPKKKKEKAGVVPSGIGERGWGEQLPKGEKNSEDRLYEFNVWSF